MIKTKSGIKINVTNTINGMLEQGGVVNRVVVVRYGSIPGFNPLRKLSDHYHDGLSYKDVITQIAYGKHPSNKPLIIIRKGSKIQ